MKVLVIGSGGREHALAWKLRHSNRVQQVFVAPGNGGTARDADLHTVPASVVNPSDVKALRAFAQAEGIALTVVGPEAPLAAGVVDEFRAHSLRIFGPTKAAAQLESSKAFSKAFMRRHGVPTADYDTFTDSAAAHAFVDRLGAPIVVKADGLAAGKGVVVAQTVAQAHAAVDFMLAADGKQGVQHNPGAGGQAVPRVVIEAFLEGEEASFIVIAHGTHCVALATSQDHKRVRDGDEGPNTGGMGAYSPAPVVTPDVHARALREVILPTLRGMVAEGNPFTGFLYAGLMIDAQGRLKTLEFNTRLGDPETQPILMRFKSDLFDVLYKATEADGAGLADLELEWDRRSALGVVMAAHGYPEAPRKGDTITGLPADSDDAMVFHAGTTQRDDASLVVSGGRVLCVTALGDSLKLAQQRAYAVVGQIKGEGLHWRSDIGHRALAR